MTILRKILLAIILLGCLKSKAQDEKESDLTKYSPRYISLPKTEKKYNTSIPVSAIEIIDARYDTNYVGLVQTSSISKDRLLRFKHGTQNEIKNYYSSLLFGDSLPLQKGIILVCFIKKLFLSDNIYLDGDQKVSAKDPVYEIKNGIMVKLEFYAGQENQFLPLYRFDTTITGSKSSLQNSHEYVAEALTASLQKLETLDWEKIKLHGKPRTYTEIDSFNRARYNMPILKENPRKGIYISFQNFKTNTPLDTPYTVEKSKRGDFLYIKNQMGEDILQTDLWGYCDGKDAYIFSAQNFFKLARTGNAFVIFGAKDFTSVRRLRLNFGLLDAAAPNSNYAKAKTFNSYALYFNLLQLDMESGELY